MREEWKKKHHYRISCVLSDALNSRPQLRYRIQFKYLSEKLLLSQKLITSEGDVSHNVLYYQKLYIARKQNCYANNDFE